MGGLALLERADAGEFPPSLYVEGPDEALKAVFLAEFRRAWALAVPDAPAARILRPGENDVDQVLSAWQSLSMFATRELTLVFDVEDYGRSETRVATLAAGIARPAGESSIVLIESAADNARKTLEPLRAACSARWVAMGLDPRELLVWGRRRLAALGLTAEPGTLEALSEACEADTIAFFNELGKLHALAGADGRVGRAEVARLVRPTVGSDLPEFLAAVALGQPALAVQRLGRLLAAGESEGGVMFALGHLVTSAFSGGRGWAIWRPQAEALSRRCPPRQLARALDAVYRGEAAWKTGRVDVRSALEQATREVSG